MFNNQNSVSLSEIIDHIKIEEELARSIISIFLRSRLLVPANNEITDADKLPLDSPLQIYSEYKNKKIRININLPIRSEQKLESDQTNRNVDEDRSILIQATIVRIMKSRKELEHSQLVAESISHLSNRFKPNVDQIKKSIEVLIEKEYVRRDTSRHEIYQYLA
ncbi:hypothetical protein GJ496_002115 [Pomphorhynchus laevis]|nr:hypothetical protein GJ496_002115 [Pomphorhynchus laevis]